MKYRPKYGHFQFGPRSTNRTQEGYQLMQKLGPNKGYNYKCHMETPNNVEPFSNVEEVLKIILISVYNMLENKLLMGQK